MENKASILTGFVVLFLLALGGIGSGVYFKMALSDKEMQVSDLTAKVEQYQKEVKDLQGSLQAALNEKEKAEAALQAALNNTSDGDGDDSRLDALKEQLALEKKKVKELTARLQNGDERQRGGRRNGFRNLEQLKQENPQAYERMQKERQRMQERMQDIRNRREQALKNLDLSKLSPEKRAQVERYQELDAQFRAMMENAENLSNEERFEQMRANRDAFREMQQLNSAIGDIMLDQAVKSGDTSSVREVLESFGGPGGFGGGPGGPGGFGGGPGGPPPGM